MRDKIQNALNNILDCMTGADGGGTFVMLRAMLEQLDKQAVKGDKAATEILVTVTRFSALIDAAQTQV